MSTKTGHELIRFGLVGAINTLLDLGTFVLFHRAFHLAPLLANTLAFGLAVTNSYFMNRRWTFRQHQHNLSFGHYLRFVAMNTGGLVIGTLAIILLQGVMPVELAKILAAGLTLIFNFTTSKYFVFRLDNS